MQIHCINICIANADSELDTNLKISRSNLEYGSLHCTQLSAECQWLANTKKRCCTVIFVLPTFSTATFSNEGKTQSKARLQE